MPDAWTPDDLRFALVRAAHFEPPRQVASDLMAAADQPATRLAEVTALQARLRAAQVLLEADEHDEGMALLRRAMQEAGPNADPRTQAAAAAVFAEAGDAAEAEALVVDAFRAHPNVHGLIGSLIKASLGLADLGQFEPALRIVDRTIERTQALPHRGRHGDLNVRIIRLAELTRRQILALQQEAQASGTDLTDRRAGRRRRDASRAELSEQASSQPHWPTLAGSCLLWWPSAEYDRVIRQVPELRDVLGSPWRGHTARVEQAMANAAAIAVPASGGAARLSLAAAGYERFVHFLEQSGGDPRLAGVMTAFTEQAGAGYNHPARWPPGQRDPCWCGSKKRYHRCCGAQQPG
jgi:tetratricopeptide (TPR) repeat protein